MVGGAQVGEFEADGAAFDFHGVIDGAGVFDVFTIGIGEGDKGEAFAEGGFVVGVDVGGFAGFDDAGDLGVGGELHDGGLLLADAGVVADVFLAGELNDVEWEIALAPAFAPVGDHGGLLVAVIGEALVAAADGFALIPERAANGVRDDGIQHAVEEDGGEMLVLDGVGLAGAGCAGLVDGSGADGGLAWGGRWGWLCRRRGRRQSCRAWA